MAYLPRDILYQKQLTFILSNIFYFVLVLIKVNLQTYTIHITYTFGIKIMNDNITNSIRKFILHFILITEVVGFTLTIGIAIVFFSTFLEMDSDQLKIAIRITLMTAVFTLLFAIISDTYRLKPIHKYLFMLEKGITDKQIVINAQKSVFRIPLFHSIDIGLRILVTAFVVISLLSQFIILETADYYNLGSLTLIMCLFVGVYTFCFGTINFQSNQIGDVRSY
ncbi:hypothetical protein LEP1GSC170_3665 [Leptospira interrogans serovar Bataviae str. HAI135]|nr:hypothetical protein LEP1GSC170_3665 [Leptospira interrogans serovar Bataviae str. HAI135]